MSTDDQVEGTSLGVQLVRGRAWCELNGFEVVGEYVDEGESGAKASRPRFDEMLAAVRRGGIDAVVVASLDRFGRSVEHNSTLLSELDRLGVRFISTSQEFDASTPMGRAMRHMASIFAEMERDMIRDRMDSGRTAVAAAGHWPCGPPPFGYRIVRDGRHSDLEIDPDEAETVRMMVACLLDERLSTGDTARRLNAMGRPTRSGVPWEARNIRRRIRDANGWAGTWVYRRPSRAQRGAAPPIEAAVPAILSPERYAALQAVMASTPTGPASTRRSYNYLLSGLVTSPHGVRYQGYQRTDHLRYMRCAHAHSQRPEPQRCKCRTISADYAETIVWEEVRRVLSDPEQLRSRAETVLSGLDETISSESVETLRRRLASAQRALGDAFTNGLKMGLDSKALSHATNRLSDEINVAKRHLAKAESWAASHTESRSRLERIWALAESSRKLLDTDDFATRRRIVELLGIQVRVTDWYRCPTCNGGGLVAVEPDPVTGKRPKGFAGTRSCPTCTRTKYLPALVITGEIPDASSLSQPLDTPGPGHPFQVVAGATG